MENAPGRRWLKVDFVVERISDTVAWIAIYTRLLQCLCGRKGFSVLTTEMESAVPRVLRTAGKSNPSFVRKLLVPLVQSKLLRSQMGETGGVRLGRPAAEITLRDIYCAVVADTKIWAPRTGIPHAAS